MSSGLLLTVAPGGVFVIAAAGFQASVEDADEAVRQPPQVVVVPVPGGALGIVERPRAG